jgi:cell division protein FtsB
MQIVFGSILAISLLLAINFSGRIAAGRRIEAQRREIEQSIQTLQAQATALRSALSYYGSDAFVEQWARREGKMVREREVLVVPVPGKRGEVSQPVPTPTPPLTLPSGSDTRTNWELWWQLFFDALPPQNNP